MNEQQFKAARIKLVVAVLLFAVLHLTWEYFNGGVVTHHFLARADMPGLSNWWGLLILPLLAWFSASAIRNRIPLKLTDGASSSGLPRGVIAGFFGMLLVATLQSVAFVTGYQDVVLYMALAVMVAAIFLPLYRMEYILGHVLGSAFVFGPAIPFVGVIMFGTISLLSHKCFKPLIQHLRGRTSGA